VSGRDYDCTLNGHVPIQQEFFFLSFFFHFFSDNDCIWSHAIGHVHRIPPLRHDGERCYHSHGHDYTFAHCHASDRRQSEESASGSS
jgi:hypothetical protein